ncbi:hypothetical protein EYF80_052225 [Liparis tanakae]|uniref:Uncharacterized protein n=1 Tax=Liparis tanakae TaxID=230148 RepID=A0A4Z2F9X8_9TELE|nr:hypothetical protein EYF80_052225 [Liparis tanakae]
MVSNVQKAVDLPVIIYIAYTFGTSSPGRNGVKTFGYAQKTSHRDPVRFYGGFKAIKTFSSVCDLSFPGGSVGSGKRDARMVA